MIMIEMTILYIIMELTINGFISYLDVNIIKRLFVLQRSNNMNGFNERYIERRLPHKYKRLCTRKN